jgi:hypothetical protein
MKQLSSRALIDKTETAHPSETSVGFEWTTRRYIPEGRILHCFIGLRTFILVNKKSFPEVSGFFKCLFSYIYWNGANIRLFSIFLYPVVFIEFDGTYCHFHQRTVPLRHCTVAKKHF